jgi:ribonuclease HI
MSCNTLCPRCLEKEETIDHAFIHCSHSSKIWFGSKLGIKFDHTHQSFSDWVTYALNSLMEEDLRHVAAITYGIWFAHNQWVFNQRNIEDTEVIIQVNASIQEYIKAITSASEQQTNNRKSTTSNQQHSTTSNRNRQWQKPANGVIKVNSDANLARAGRWGCGATYRDSTGTLVAAATWELPGPEDATLAEVYAVYNAINLAKDCGFQNVLIESDCERAISLIRSTACNPRSYVGDVVRSIRNTGGQFRNCSFRHVHREANQAAHLLASLAH